GRVLDTRTSRDVYSTTHVSRDSTGNLNSHTTHDVVVSHNTWLHDLNNDVDVNYSGSGSIKARPGHVLGTMSYKGSSCIDVNYSTGTIYTVNKASKSILGSIFVAGFGGVLGFFFFPIMMLVVLFRPDQPAWGEI